MKDYLNQLGCRKIPFLFVIDFNLQNFYISPLQQIDSDILFHIDGFTNFNPTMSTSFPCILKKNRLIGKIT